MSQFYFTRDNASASRANASSQMTPHELHAVKVTQAYWSVSQNGAKFLSVNFENAVGESADDIKIYFESNAGERWSGYHQINAMLAFNNIAGLSQAQGTYRTYDFEQGGVVDKQGLIAPELVGAYVGVIFFENYYVGQNGIRHSLSLSAVYHHKSQQNAKQFLSNTPAVPNQVEQSIAYAKNTSEKSRKQAENKAGKGKGNSNNSNNQSGWGNTPQGFGQSNGFTDGFPTEFVQQAPQGQPMNGQQMGQNMGGWGGQPVPAPTPQGRR